jgi:23S rRNA (adenine2503-C2)-methyltransferase
MQAQDTNNNDERVDLYDLTFDQLQTFLTETIGEPKFRTKQVFRWLYEHEVRDFSSMTNLSKATRAKLEKHSTVGTMHLLNQEISEDGTRKLLFQLQDGRSVESVVIPSLTDHRVTLCISSQVGCALGCKFCYTATMGPGRNLRVGEFLGQFLGANQLLEEGQKITNVVFMGMGEPLVNFSNLLSTLNLLTDKRGIGLGARRLTVSTAGLIPQILKLKEQYKVRLAISLHATTDGLRNEIMPINQRYPLKELVKALRTFQEGRRLPITLEYTLMEGINDSMLDARRLRKIALSIPGKTKVNLIPFNEHPGAPYKRPEWEAIQEFRAEVDSPHLTVTMRTPRGDDISAACGQLAIQGQNKKPRSKAQNAPLHRRYQA